MITPNFGELMKLAQESGINENELIGKQSNNKTKRPPSKVKKERRLKNKRVKKQKQKARK